jgi:hypothetical protein
LPGSPEGQVLRGREGRCDLLEKEVNGKLNCTHKNEQTGNEKSGSIE